MKKRYYLLHCYSSLRWGLFAWSFSAVFIHTILYPDFNHYIYIKICSSLNMNINIYISLYNIYLKGMCLFQLFFYFHFFFHWKLMLNILGSVSLLWSWLLSRTGAEPPSSPLSNLAIPVNAGNAWWV